MEHLMDTAAETDTETDTEAPVAVVHVEACVAFVGDADAAEGVCLACGWLGEDHEDLFAFLADAPAAAAA